MNLADWLRLLRKTSRIPLAKARIRRKREHTSPLWLERLETRTLPAPMVTAIDRSVPSTAVTDATSVTYAVDFNTNVTGVDATDFQVTTAVAVQATTPVVVAGSGAAYTVTISGIHGSGQLRLDLIDDDSIKDSSSEPLGGAGAGNGSFQGQSYYILQTYPVVVSINRFSPSGQTTNAGSVSFQVTFSETVTGVDPTDFDVARTGTVGTTLVQVTPVSGSVYDVTVSGITGAGTLGLNLVDDGSIQDSAGNPLTTSNASAAFEDQQTFASGEKPASVALGDVNGDGKPDLATVNYDSRFVSVLLGNGNGTFETRLSFAAGDFPLSVALGDVNGDGRLDLAVVNFYSNTVSVLLGNGNGTFQARQNFDTKTFPASVTLGDVNGDGRPDLSVANSYFIYPNASNSVSVLLGNGNGAFQAQQTFATGSGPVSVALGDVNGDDNPDLAVANSEGNTVGVLLGTGDGTFHAQQAFATGERPRSVALADVNGDLHPDLAVANTDRNTVSVLLGNGNGKFQTQQTFATGTAPYSVAVADVNGDGRPDLAVANSRGGTLSVLLGNGNGTFQAQQTFATGNKPYSVVPGDLNGDGRPDLAVANFGSSTLSVLLNAVNGDFTGETYTIDQVAPYVKSINRLTPSSSSTDATSVIFEVAFSETVTGVDVTDFHRASSGSVATNLLAVNAVSGSVYEVLVSGISGVGTLGLNLEDDGSITDLASNRLTTSNAAAAFQGQQTFSVGSRPNSVALGDVNADENPDLAVANFSSNTASVLLGNGNGTFQAHQNFSTGSEPYAVALGDVNGDGKPDLAVANSGNNSVSVRLGNGNGTFQAQPTFETGDAPYSVALGDVNGDGSIDLAVANRVSNTVSVLLGNGNGTFQTQRTFGAGASPSSVTLGDVNEDGSPDLAVADTNGNTVSVLLGNGNGTFQARQTFAAGSRPIPVTLGDVNGDGKPDLAVANFDSKTVSVLMGNGNGTFQTQQTFATGAGPISVTLGDVNGDGKPDLAVANYNSNTLSVLLGNGNGTFQAQHTFAVGNSPRSVALGDVNGDGRPDLAVANGRNDTAGVLLDAVNGDFTGETYTIAARTIVTALDAGGGPEVRTYDASTQELITSFNSYDPQFTGGVRVAAGDVNNDGVSDIITAPGPGGGPDIHVYDGSTNQLLKQFWAFDANFTGGVFVAAGDVDGDDYADIICGADAGAGPHVTVFSGKDGTRLLSFFAYDSGFAGGVRVAAGDTDGAGAAEIITGAGSGGGPHVMVFQNKDGHAVALQSYFAFDPGFTGGIYVGAGDVNGDGHADVIVGAGAGGGPHVAVFAGSDAALLLGFFAFDANFSGGVRVAGMDVNGDGNCDLILSPGPGGGPHVKVVDFATQQQLDAFFAYNATFTGGLYVAGNGK